MKRTADMTVAIATLNRPRQLARCLDTLLAGTVLPAEVVVIDQGQAAPAQQVVEQRANKGVALVYLRQAQTGLSASRNEAFAHARYPIVAVTDDDCVPDREWVATIDRTSTNSPELGGITGRVSPLGPEVPGMFVVAPRESPIRVRFHGKVLPWLIGSGNNFAVRRDWFLRVGGCDELLGVGSAGKAAEDMDLFYKLLREGTQIQYEPDAIVYHERQSRARRLASRWSYGYGMGAFCSIWLRRRDSYALYILARWVDMQCRALAWGILRLQGRLAVYQRVLSLFGTARGAAFGLTAYKPAQALGQNHVTEQ